MSDVRTIDAYLAEVRAHLTQLGASERDEALTELESLLRADAERSGEAAAVDAVGDAPTYAAGILEALRENDTADLDGRPIPQGHVLGMPYDFRGASVERISSRVWNPADPRIFMPRMFGLGWTINLGAIAVKLGLIRPDDVADESYDRIPAPVVTAVVALPAILVLVAVAVLLVAWPTLPAELPIHWGVSGQADDWAPRAWVIGLLLIFALLPPALSYPKILKRGTPARSRLLAAAGLGMAAILVLGIALVTIADANGGASGDWVLLVVLGMFAVPFLMLYVPLHLGLRAEWRGAISSDDRED
ncbi:MAG: DUF1648 domain-containing protein [Coriobacteriia bacterium]